MAIRPEIDDLPPGYKTIYDKFRSNHSNLKKKGANTDLFMFAIWAYQNHPEIFMEFKSKELEQELLRNP